jgi:hypothetical protein
MNGDEPEVARQFFSTGVETYLDARDAIAEFERQVIKRCTKVAQNKLAAIESACGAGFWPTRNLIDFNAGNRLLRRVGVRLDGHDARLLFCLWWSRGNAPVYRALVLLVRTHVRVPNGLWERRPKADASGLILRDTRKLWFGPVLSVNNISDFDDHLEEAIIDFVKFVEEADGLGQWFRPGQ